MSDLSQDSGENIILRRIPESLDAYRDGRLTLSGLVGELEEAISNLDSGPLADALHEQWWTLEQVYAVDLDRDELDQHPADSTQLIEEALRSMAALMQRALKRQEFGG